MQGKKWMSLAMLERPERNVHDWLLKKLDFLNWKKERLGNSHKLAFEGIQTAGMSGKLLLCLQFYKYGRYLKLKEFQVGDLVVMQLWHDGLIIRNREGDGRRNRLRQRNHLGRRNCLGRRNRLATNGDGLGSANTLATNGDGFGLTNTPVTSGDHTNRDQEDEQTNRDKEHERTNRDREDETTDRDSEDEMTDPDNEDEPTDRDSNYEPTN